MIFDETLISDHLQIWVKNWLFIQIWDVTEILFVWIFGLSGRWIIYYPDTEHPSQNACMKMILILRSNWDFVAEFTSFFHYL